MTDRVHLGNLSVVVPSDPEPDILILQHQAIFAPITAFLAALTGFAVLSEAYNSDYAKRWAPHDLIVLDAVACGRRLRIAPDAMIQRMMQNWQIDSIKLEVEVIAMPPLLAPPPLGGAHTLLHGANQALFTTFYEDNRSFINSTYAAAWPDEWKFARVVRNALAHNFKLDIRKAHVQWRTLTYTDADHGRQIIFTDLWPGDLILLMIDMSAAL